MYANAEGVSSADRDERAADQPMNADATDKTGRDRRTAGAAPALLAGRVHDLASGGALGVLALKLASGGAALLGIEGGGVVSAHCAGYAGREALDACLTNGVVDGAWWENERVVLERAPTGQLEAQDWTLAVANAGEGAAAEGAQPDERRVPPAPLVAGTVLDGDISVAGPSGSAGAYTLAYEGTHLTTLEPVLITEHAPRGLALRGEDGKTIVATEKEPFWQAAGAWSTGAERLSAIRHGAILHPIAVRHGHGTVVVMSKRETKGNETRVTQTTQALKLAQTLLEALATVHEQGVVGPDLRRCARIVAHPAIAASGYVLDALGELQLAPSEPCGAEGLIGLGAPSVRTDLHALGAALLGALDGSRALPSADVRCFGQERTDNAVREQVIPHWASDELRQLIEWLIEPLPWRRPRNARAALKWIEPVVARENTNRGSPQPAADRAPSAQSMRTQAEQTIRGIEGAAPSETLVAIALETLSEQLGPFAEVVIAQSLATNPPLETFIDELAGSLTDYPDAQGRFVERMQHAMHAVVGPGPGRSHKRAEPYGAQDSAHDAGPPNANVVSIAREMLTEELGPFAAIEINELLERNVGVEEFIAELAKTLSNRPAACERFTKQMHGARTQYTADA